MGLKKCNEIKSQVDFSVSLIASPFLSKAIIHGHISLIPKHFHKISSQGNIFDMFKTPVQPQRHSSNLKYISLMIHFYPNIYQL